MFLQVSPGPENTVYMRRFTFEATQEAWLVHASISAALLAKSNNNCGSQRYI